MTSFGSNLQLHIQQSVEESAVPLEGDAQIFSRDVVAATPLPLQSRTRIGEAICQALDYFGNQRISLLDSAPRFVHEGRLDFRPARAELLCLVVGE